MNVLNSPLFGNYLESNKETILWLNLMYIYDMFIRFIAEHSVVSNSLQPHGLQRARLLCPSPSPGACSNSCPLSQRHHPTILSYHPHLLLPSVFPSIRVFSNESALHIRWPKYWSFNFSINPSSEYSGLISFRIGWFDLFAVQKTLRSLLQHHNYMSAQRKTKYCTENLAKITQKGKIKCYFLFLLWIFLYFQKFLCLPN